MEDNSKEIAISDVKQFITVEEMNALLTVLKSRQQFFEQMVRQKEESEDKMISKLESQGENMPEGLGDKLKLLSSEFAKQMDKRFFEDFKEELEVQEGINEFLLRFTGEPQTNYKNLFLHEEK